MGDAQSDRPVNGPVPAPAEAEARLRLDAPVIALSLLLVATTLVRLTVGQGRPLWFDESWTGMIAAQSSLGDFAHECWLELNPPLYYVVSRLSAGVFGLSDGALRLPSLLFAVAAPLLPLVAARTVFDRDTRFLWSGLLACWAPALWFGHDARGYAMLVFLAVLNTIAFARALRLGGRKTALLWASSGSLVILTHYFAGFLVLAQGLVYLAARRRRALADWPALAGLLPAMLWIAWHWPRLEQASRPDLMAYPLVSLGSWWRITGFVIGSPLLLLPLLVWCAAALLAFSNRPAVPPPVEVDRARQQAVLAAVAGVMLVLVLAAFRPMLEPKYLTAFIPGLMLGLAGGARAASRRWQTAGVALLTIYAVGVIFWVRQPTQPETHYSFEAASDHLMHAGTTRLVFFWDHPLLPIEDPAQLGKVGGFFFHRARRPVPVDTIILAAGQDPNAVLAARAAAPQSGVLWLYNNRVRGTAVRAYPQALARFDPRWRCRDFGDAGLGIGILACTRSPQ